MRRRLLSALAAGTLALVVGTSTAYAINQTQYPCQVAIAKEGLKFVKGELKVRQKCINANLVTLGSCPAPDAGALLKLRDKLRTGLAKKCTFLTPFATDVTPGNLAGIGFPGPCIDPNTADQFTITDLQDCIEDSHKDIVTSMLAVQYDADVTTGTLADTALTCQKTIASNSAKYVAALMKNVQKCRNDLLNCSTDPNTLISTCKLSGLLPQDCATDPGPATASACTGGTNAGAKCSAASECPGSTCDGVKFANQKTVDAIAKAKAKANDAIVAKCSDPDVVLIEACEPNQTTGPLTASCELDLHEGLTNDPDPLAPSELIDYEYAQRGLCGDDRKNLPSEECDGNDDSDCPGDCGTPLGLFPCLCQDIPRTRVVEHENSDLDNGWTGQSHDSGIVEGGGYVTDLWDCDGPAGPDTTCNVGPTCSLGLKQPCAPAPGAPANLDTGNEICAAKVPSQGVCRKTAGGATGPHCEIDFQKRCTTGAQCTTFDGDRCVMLPHGPPLPLSSGGVSVCVVNIFSEDIVGTTNLDPTPGSSCFGGTNENAACSVASECPGGACNPHGSGAVRLRQGASTYLGPDQQQPCPVCGGFCSGAGGATSPGARNLCSTNADCSGGATCITASVCSWGPNKDKACRPNTPGGGTTAFFGNPSVDCPMAGSLLGTIDILFNPATTGATTKTANTHCDSTGFTNKVCAGGTNQHAVCTVASECPGGTCNEQCFCPDSSNPGFQKPSACEAACLGGPDDAAPCIDNSECDPPGFCHPADCRLNPSDTDSTQEGLCTVGPVDGTCSVNSFKTCSSDAQCQDPVCTFCEPGETCVFTLRQCFVNPTISRAGEPGTPDRRTAALFCITATGSAAVDAVAGLPGPGAITNPVTTTEVGF